MENNQNQQGEKEEGPISQTINTLNNIPVGLKNPFGKIASGAATQAARGITGFLVANPWVWIVLGIIILTTIVFVIVVSGVAPGAPTQTTTPALEP